MPIGLSDFVSPLGTFAIAQDDHLLGAYRSVADAAARDAIPAGRRKEGMLVRTNDTGETWVLGAGLTNGDWSLFSSGGGGSSLSILIGTDVFSNVSNLRLPFGSKAYDFAGNLEVSLPSFSNGAARSLRARSNVRAPWAVTVRNVASGNVGDLAWYRSYDNGAGGHKEFILFVDSTGPLIRRHNPGSSTSSGTSIPAVGKLLVSGDWVFLATASTVEAYQRIDVGGTTRTYTPGSGGTGFGGYIASGFPGGPGGGSLFDAALSGGTEWIFVGSPADLRVYAFQPGDASGSINVAFDFTGVGYEPRGIAVTGEGQAVVLSKHPGSSQLQAWVFNVDNGVLNHWLDFGLGTGESTNLVSDGKWLFFLAVEQNKLYRINTSRAVEQIPLPGVLTVNLSSRVYFDGAFVLITSSNGYLWRVDPETLETISIQQITAGAALSGLALPPTDTGIFFTASNNAGPFDSLYQLEVKDSTKSVWAYQNGGFIASARRLNFVGATLAHDSDADQVNVTITPSVSVYHNGGLIGTRPSINLLGAGVGSVTDNGGQNRVDINIAGGGGGGGSYGDGGSALRAQQSTSLQNLRYLFTQTAPAVWGHRSFVIYEGLIFSARDDGTGNGYDITYHDHFGQVLGVIENVTGIADTVSNILVYETAVFGDKLIVVDDNSVRIYSALTVDTLAQTPQVNTDPATVIGLPFSSDSWRACIKGNFLHLVPGAIGAPTDILTIALESNFMLPAYTHTDTALAVTSGPGPTVFITDSAGQFVSFTQDNSGNLTPALTANIASPFFDIKFDGRDVWLLKEGELRVFNLGSQAVSSAYVGPFASSARLAFDGMTMWAGWGSITQNENIQFARFSYDGSTIIREALVDSGLGAGDGEGVAAASNGTIVTGGRLAGSLAEATDDVYRLALDGYDYANSAVAGTESITDSTTTDSPAVIFTSGNSTPIYIYRWWAQIIVNSTTTGSDDFTLTLKQNGSPVDSYNFIETGTGTFYIDVNEYPIDAQSGDEFRVEIGKTTPASDPMDWSFTWGLVWHNTAQFLFSVSSGGGGGGGGGP